MVFAICKSCCETLWLCRETERQVKQPVRAASKDRARLEQVREAMEAAMADLEQAQALERDALTRAKEKAAEVRWGIPPPEHSVLHKLLTRVFRYSSSPCQIHGATMCAGRPSGPSAASDDLTRRATSVLCYLQGAFATTLLVVNLRQEPKRVRDLIELLRHLVTLPIAAV